MKKKKISIEVDMPEGCEETGEFCTGILFPDLISGYVVIRKIKQYREPSLPADLFNECEFSDDGESWEKQKLLGYYKDTKEHRLPWWGEQRQRYVYCRIECTPAKDPA